MNLTATLSLVRYVLLAARRDRLFNAMGLLLLAAAGLSMFMGGAASTERLEFAAVIAGTSVRLISSLGLVLFTAFHLRRAFENREIEMLLSRPVRRADIIIGYGIALMALATVVALAGTLTVAAIGRNVPFAGLALWGAGLWGECLIMTLATLFFAIMLSSAVTSTLACLGFYVLARLVGALTGIAQLGADTVFDKILGKGMETVSILIPRLDLFGQTAWLVHGPDSTIGYGLIAAQTLIFGVLLLSATVFDFSRRQF